VNLDINGWAVGQRDLGWLNDGVAQLDLRSWQGHAGLGWNLDVDDCRLLSDGIAQLLKDADKIAQRSSCDLGFSMSTPLSMILFLQAVENHFKDTFTSPQPFHRLLVGQVFLHGQATVRAKVLEGDGFWSGRFGFWFGL
jgi:hypothetical protein